MRRPSRPRLPDSSRCSRRRPRPTCVLPSPSRSDRFCATPWALSYTSTGRRPSPPCASSRPWRAAAISGPGWSRRYRGLLGWMWRPWRASPARLRAAVWSRPPRIRSRRMPPPDLARFGYDIGKLAREGGLDPVVGCRDPMRAAAAILLRRSQNSAVIVGSRAWKECVRARAGGRDRAPGRARTEGVARHGGVGAGRGGDPGRGDHARCARGTPSEHRPRTRRHRHGALRRRPAHAHGVRLECRGGCTAGDALAAIGAPPRHLRMARVAPAHRARSGACPAARRGAGGGARRCRLRRGRRGTAAPAGRASRGRNLR